MGDRPPPSSRNPSSSAQHALNTGTRPSLENAASAAIEAQAILVHTVSQAPVAPSSPPPQPAANPFPSVPPIPAAPIVTDRKDSPKHAERHSNGEEGRGLVVRGGSQPPFRTDPPARPVQTNTSRGSERVEKAEMLSLPPGLHGESSIPGELPTNGMEARIYFTHQSRELGRLYRQRYNVELRTDVRSIEILQRHLAERFESGELSSFNDVVEVRLHGAFLSEILARRLGAEWTDLAVTEIGYWAMSVPPGTTVWPIGRVVRFVTMQHRERDLVSYFLELQARAHGLR